MMKNTPIRFLVILGALTLASIVFIQIYWVSQAVDRQEEQFKHSVQMALRNVVEALCEINGNDIPSNDPIDQLSNNYFIARTNYRIDLSSLDYLLRAELEKRQINQDYEFGVYDCQTDLMVYGDYISLKEKKEVKRQAGKLPTLVNDEYYFGVYFPEKSAGIVSSMGIWKFTSALTLIILIFFSYALFVILKQKRLSEIQKDFVNNMTHEFKTPLATLQVSAEVLVNESSSARQRKYAEIALAEVDRLQQHVRQLLETSLLDHEKTGKNAVRFNATDVVKGVLQRFREVPGMVLKEQISADDAFLYGDARNLELILINLLDNAIKYGQCRVEVTMASEGKHIRLEVWNDGTPIPPGERRRVFDKFYRIHTGDVHDVRGFGLGLYLVKKAVRQLKGTVALSSDTRGNSFVLNLPGAR